MLLTALLGVGLGRPFGEGYTAAPADGGRGGDQGGKNGGPVPPRPSFSFLDWPTWQRPVGRREKRLSAGSSALEQEEQEKPAWRGKLEGLPPGAAGVGVFLPLNRPPTPNLQPGVIAGKQSVPKQTAHEAGARVHSLTSQAQRREEGLRGRGEALPSLDPSLEPR